MKAWKGWIDPVVTEKTCQSCGGHGSITGGYPCPTCNGTGVVKPENREDSDGNFGFIHNKVI